ncbi:thioredoxin [Kwoniella pini CBS 10737]|uniref:Thioredoxin n=1 Tax=Kwoniella pini CBS 10737 TaxID=1296096 RepID=A0A1B9IDL8_9TREE|nr:thioredoxin [Kwoniella pini CBS 10737]OCF53587.1 thioredoxin [Kwoniella pini CBS 10737]
MVKAIESKSEFDSLIAGSEPVVVDYWATWCGPCKMISPHFAKLEAEYPGVKFVKVDVEEQEEIALFAGIKAMPTFIAYKDGQPIETVTGAVPAKLNALLEKISA